MSRKRAPVQCHICSITTSTDRNCIVGSVYICTGQLPLRPVHYVRRGDHALRAARRRHRAIDRKRLAPAGRSTSFRARARPTTRCEPGNRRRCVSSSGKRRARRRRAALRTFRSPASACGKPSGAACAAAKHFARARVREQCRRIDRRGNARSERAAARVCVSVARCASDRGAQSHARIDRARSSARRRKL